MMYRHRSGSLKAAAIALALLTVGTSIALAQRGFGGGNRGTGGGEIYVDESVTTARDVGTRIEGALPPEWSNPVGFEADVLTFARLRFDKTNLWNRLGFGRPRGGGGWTTDLPDADVNLSYRLQQITAIRTDPNGRLIRATDPELAKYPFLFIAAPNTLTLEEKEAIALRKYLNAGGFILMTDFWGNDQWANVEEIFKQILPSQSFVELPIEHPLYQSVFKIREKSQVPQSRVGQALEGVPRDSPSYWTGPSRGGGDTADVHHRVIFDAKGRIMVMALHNSDDSDGWERETEQDFYFREFSQRAAYPLAINVLFYILTH